MKRLTYVLLFIGFAASLALFVRIYDRALFEVIFWFFRVTCFLSIIVAIGLFLLEKIFGD